MIGRYLNQSSHLITTRIIKENLQRNFQKEDSDAKLDGVEKEFRSSERDLNTKLTETMEEKEQAQRKLREAEDESRRKVGI